MAYQSTKPAATDQISVSQGDLQGNFIAIGTMLDPNLKSVTFPETGSHITIANEVALYAKPSLLAPNDTALWFVPENGGTAVDFTTATKAADGWCRLPSGIIFKWGTGACAQNAATTVNFPVAAGIPVFGTILNVMITAVGFAGRTGTVFYQSSAVGSVTVWSTGSNAPTSFNYLAIGI